MGNVVRIRNGMSNATEGDILGSVGDIVKTLGVVDLEGGHLLVTEDSPTGMSVQVAGGIVYVANSNYDELNSDTPKFYPVVCDSEVVTIDGNVSGSTRIDIVCVKVDKTIMPDADADNIATKVIVKGTPGAGVPSTPANHYKLAEIVIANGETEITNTEITDTREQIIFDERYIKLTTATTTDLTGLVGADGSNIEQVTKPTGAIVGTTDTQTLTNKTLTNPTINFTDKAASMNVKCRVTLSADHTLANGVTETIPFNTEDYDIGSDFNTSTYKFIAPVAGYYLVTLNVRAAGLSDGKRLACAVKVGSSNILLGQTDSAGSSSSGYVSVNLSTILSLSVDDEVTATAYHDSGSNMDIQASSTSMAIHLLST